MKVALSVISFVTLLSGCGDASNNNGSSSALVGVWETKSCEQASDNNGVLQNMWVKALYEFTSQGKILLGTKQYQDANCITLNSTTVPTEIKVPVSYWDQGSRLLSEGINGGGLSITMQLLTIDGFYNINNNTLCFSDAFTFGSIKFAIAEAGLTSINFSRCLIKN